MLNLPCGNCGHQEETHSNPKYGCMALKDGTGIWNGYDEVNRVPAAMCRCERWVWPLEICHSCYHPFSEHTGTTDDMMDTHCQHGHEWGEWREMLIKGKGSEPDKLIKRFFKSGEPDCYCAQFNPRSRSTGRIPQ